MYVLCHKETPSQYILFYELRSLNRNSLWLLLLFISHNNEAYRFLNTSDSVTHRFTGVYIGVSVGTFKAPHALPFEAPNMHYNAYTLRSHY